MEIDAIRLGMTWPYLPLTGNKDPPSFGCFNVPNVARYTAEPKTSLQDGVVVRNVSNHQGKL